MLFANCHFHSTFSDGVYTPEKLVELARDLGYRALVLTDHDTVRGNYYLARAARKVGLLSISGCEFTTKGLGTGFHLVGMDFDPYTKKMTRLLEIAAAKQTSRSRWLFEHALETKNIPTDITWQEVLDFFPHNDYFCNNQIFDTMVAKGLYTPDDYNDFFHANFSGRLGYEKIIQQVTGYTTPDIEEVIDAILDAGGIPIVAHPAGKEAYAEDLVRMGVKGFETSHPSLSEEDKKFFTEFCREHNLYQSGGTDHDAALGGLVGRMPDKNESLESGYVNEENFMKLYTRALG